MTESKEGLRAVFIILAMTLLFIPPAYAEVLEVNIERALDLALANNNRIKIAESDAAIAGEARRQAHRAKGVSVNVNHSSSYTDYQGESYLQSHGESYGNRITVSYPLYTGGVLGGAMEKADSDYKSQGEALRKSHQDLKFDVTSGVYTILRAADAAHQAEESELRLSAHVDNVRIQYENGRVGKADLLRSEVELSNAKQSRIRAASDLDISVKQLNNLMGVPLDTELRIDEKMAYEKYTHALEECVSYARQVHPSLTMASLAIESAEAEARMAKGNMLPTASVSAVQNLGSASSWPGWEADSFSIGIDIEYTLTDAGVGASRVSSAEEALKRAKFNYEGILESVILSVNSDYNSITEAALRVEESASAISKAREAYDIAVNRYNEGVGTNIDVVDFQSALTVATSNHTQALCDYNIALARIENSMGGPLR
ncbi:MAG: TolC family protein [Synergistaceae bacterium]|jgi:outer membrane protein TolC|nr:TolC family protein [Synergistaceae bacterium]